MRVCIRFHLYKNKLHFSTIPNSSSYFAEHINFECFHQTLLLLMKLRSIVNFNKSFIIGNRIYNLAAQISYHNGDMIDFSKNHFYSRVKIGDQYYKMDGKNSITKERSANPDKVILALYKVNGSTETVEEVNENIIYDTKALAYFRRSTENYKEKDRLRKEEEYHEYGGKQKKMQEYRENEEELKEKAKKQYHEFGGKEKKLEKAKKDYHEHGGKQKKQELYIQNRQKRLEYATTYYRRQDKIKKILSQHFNSYDSGMEYLCVSCTRLHSRGNVSKHRMGVNTTKDEKLILTSRTRNMDDNFYICSNCKPALKGFPRLNFIKTGDFDKIGSIPNHLPDLNILESYLLKITIPFIRVSHVPRSPNLKLVGGSVCIEADINHTVRRLQINPESIIPVSFKRKLSFSGYYLEQVLKITNLTNLSIIFFSYR